LRVGVGLRQSRRDVLRRAAQIEFDRTAGGVVDNQNRSLLAALEQSLDGQRDRRWRARRDAPIAFKCRATR
jgi:hypothetical protein